MIPPAWTCWTARAESPTTRRPAGPAGRAASRSASDPPGTNSMTKYGSPSASPKSYSCDDVRVLSRATARGLEVEPHQVVGPAVGPPRTTLMATGRSSSTCRPGRRRPSRPARAARPPRTRGRAAPTLAAGGDEPAFRPGRARWSPRGAAKAGNRARYSAAASRASGRYSVRRAGARRTARRARPRAPRGGGLRSAAGRPPASRPRSGRRRFAGARPRPATGGADGLRVGHVGRLRAGQRAVSHLRRIRSSFRSTVASDLPIRPAISRLVCPSSFHRAICRSSSSSSPSRARHWSATSAANAGTRLPPDQPSRHGPSRRGPRPPALAAARGARRRSPCGR